MRSEPLVLLLLGAWTAVQGLEVYDCEAVGTKIRSLDLEEPAPCPDPEGDYRDPEPEYGQLLQFPKRRTVNIAQCRGTVTKQITHCGIASTTYGGLTTVYEETINIDPEECLRIVKEKKWHGQRLVYGVPSKTVTMTRGSVDTNGWCEAEDFMSGGQYYYSSYEETFRHLYIDILTGLVKPGHDEITVENGLRGSFAKGTMLDSQEGRLAWKVDTPECEKGVSQIYKGFVSLHRSAKRNLTDPSKQDGIVILEDKESGRIGGFALRSPLEVCGQHCWSTSVSELVLCFRERADTEFGDFKFNPAFAQAKVDMWARIGHALLTNTLTIDDRLTTILRSICRIDRRILRHKLQAIANGNPYALLQEYGRGNLVSVGGTVAYITQCVPRNASLASFPNCTAEIPIQFQDVKGDQEPQTFFADPFTRIVTRVATILPCSELTPVSFKSGNEWRCASANSAWRPCPAPEQLRPEIIRWEKKDHAEGLNDNESLFNEQQRAQHRLHQRAVTTRSAVVQGLTNAANLEENREHARYGYPGLPFDASDWEEVATQVGLSYMPWMRDLHFHFKTMMYTLIVLGFVKALLEWALSCVMIYRDRGFGWWILASFFNLGAQQALRPWRFTMDMIHGALDPRKILALLKEEELHPERAAIRRRHARRTRDLARKMAAKSPAAWAINAQRRREAEEERGHLMAFWDYDDAASDPLREDRRRHNSLASEESEDNRGPAPGSESRLRKLFRFRRDQGASSTSRKDAEEGENIEMDTLKQSEEDKEKKQRFGDE